MKSLLRKIKNNLFPHPKISSVEIPVFKGDLLKGKTALIIGGSGGIGSKIAKTFVENGCRVIITGTNEAKLQDVCHNIGTEMAHYVVADVSRNDETKRLVNEAVELSKKIDIFVHSAGVHCHDMFGSVTEQVWDTVMNINLKSVYFSCQEISNYMIENHIKGHMLIVSSASSAKPGWTPYEISKNGVKALTLGFADKLIKYGIVVNSIAPGPVSTPMLGKNDTSDIAWTGNPTGRMSTPAEIANWALFMVSDIGNMVVGDTFYISGGSGTICLDK